MNDSIFGLAGFGLALLLIAFGVPVAIAMSAIGVIGYWWLNGWAGIAYIMGSTPFESVFPYSFSVIPLFVMMGVFAARAGLSRSLFDMLNSFLGHVRGGLAVTTIGASALFGSICGSSLATVATIGRVAIPEMRRHGYSDSISAATVAAGGTLGVLIPPSILLVIYGLLTQSSIGKLFVGALIPGLLGTLLYVLAVLLQVRLSPSVAPKAVRVDWRQRFRLLGRIWPVALLFVVVIGGIYTGWFSPTEAAAVGAVGAFLLALLSAGMTRTGMKDTVAETAGLTGMIFLILIGAALFTAFIESTGLPQFLIQEIELMGLSPLMVMILILIFYLVLGCFMDSMSMILLTVPLIAPLVTQIGYDPIWFGIMVVTVAEVGLITPPIGMNLFVVQATVPGLKQSTVVKGIWPFVLMDVVRMLLLLAFPMLVLWMPSSM